MPVLYLLVAAAFVIAGLGPADAHPGHIADNGHGHSHWLALAILGGLAALAAGGIIFRLVTGRLPFFNAQRTGR